LAKAQTDRITSTLSLNTPDAVEWTSEWMKLSEQIKTERLRIEQGGGKSNIAKQHQKGRLTARERIDLLKDDDAVFYEIGRYAAFDMYKEWGGAPAAGVITGITRIQGRMCMVIANDATVKAGSFFPMTSKKVIRAQTIAYDNYIPVVYLVDSAGIFLPLQEDVFPDQDDFGRVFYLNARMSARGIPQITAILGMCVAGGAYLPVMTDTVLMTEGSGLFLAGPALVKAAIGQVVSAEELGGATMHEEISGTIDFKEPDDPSALAHIRKLVQAMPDHRCVSATKFDTPYYREPLSAVVPINTSSRVYNIYDVIARIVDGSEFLEYKQGYGETVVCGYAHIGGYPTGIVANQKKHIMKKGAPPQFGGVIYKESAEKAARFIMDCNQKKIPLLFIHDVNGFMVGKEAEQSGIIKAGAKMVNAVSNSIVPKISLIIGGSFGAGNYAMCGKAYAPDFIYAWPNAHYAVMGGAQAANTLAGIKIRQLERSGLQLNEEDKQKLIDEIKATYDSQSSAQYAAARLWVDEIILPEETRERLIASLEAVTQNPERFSRRFSTGVLQT